jgi:hypothetical protein
MPDVPTRSRLHRIVARTPWAVAMTTRPLTSVKPIVGKDGKTRLVRRRGYMAKNKAIKADRLVKAWQKAGRKT